MNADERAEIQSSLKPHTKLGLNCQSYTVSEQNRDLIKKKILNDSTFS